MRGERREERGERREESGERRAESRSTEPASLGLVEGGGKARQGREMPRWAVVHDRGEGRGLEDFVTL